MEGPNVSPTFDLRELAGIVPGRPTASLLPDRIVACIRDGSSVNGCCGRFFTQLNPDMLDITCVSHTICRCDLFDCSTAKQFISTWSLLIKKSGKARLLFQKMSQQQAQRKSSTRWFTEYQVCSQVFKKWSAVISVINHKSEFASNLRPKH